MAASACIICIPSLLADSASGFIVIINGGFCLFFIALLPSLLAVLPLGSLLVINGGFCLFYSIAPFVIGG
jgi:hypothetical protein